MWGRLLARQAKKPSGWFGRNFITKLLNRRNYEIELFGLETLDVQPDDQILEIGPGNGRLMKWVSEKLSKGKVSGIDLSKDMVIAAQKKLREEILANKAEIKQSGISSIPYANSSFNKIITCNSIYFWPEPQQDIKEILRVLKPEGMFICGMRLKDQMLKRKLVAGNREVFKNIYSEEEVVLLLKNGGFINVELRTKPAKLFYSHLFISRKSRI